MPIINLVTMKTIDEREAQKTAKQKETKTVATAKGWELNDIVVHLS